MPCSERGSPRADRSEAGPRAAPDPDPGERGRVYEAARAQAEADLGETEPRGYWAEVPRLRRMWVDHDERWPAEPRAKVAADRSADPPGSHRSDGAFYLSPARNAEATAAIGRIREGEPPISVDVRTAERENTFGGRLEGFEFRLKGDDRLKEKVAEQLKAEPGKTSSEVLRRILDAIRYTFCLQPETYSRGYYDIQTRLESCGHEMYASTNSWGSQEYKGINTRWVTQEGHRFEVQFHTPESFDAR
jgi:hypothetical protein